MLTCITRSMNNELYQLMLSLCPSDWEFIKVENSTATGYLDYIFNTKFKTRWVLNLDEDCFINDETEVLRLIGFLEENSYDYCGVQDGGSISVRIHNPLVSNPFFNLFDNERIYPLEKTYFRTNYAPELMKEKYSHFVRFRDGEYKYDFFEPFYSQFFWLLENGLQPYFLNAEDFTNERYLVIAPLLRVWPYFNSPTLIRNFDDKQIAVHTWHSRYLNYPNIRKHIMNCYENALGERKKSSNKFEILVLNK